MENNNIEYKWKKIFASMRLDTDTGTISLTPAVQQELIDDISTLRELKSDLIHNVSYCDDCVVNTEKVELETCNTCPFNKNK